MPSPFGKLSQSVGSRWALRLSDRYFWEFTILSAGTCCPGPFAMKVPQNILGRFFGACWVCPALTSSPALCLTTDDQIPGTSKWVSFENTTFFQFLYFLTLAKCFIFISEISRAFLRDLHVVLQTSRSLKWIVDKSMWIPAANKSHRKSWLVFHGSFTLLLSSVLPSCVYDHIVHAFLLLDYQWLHSSWWFDIWSTLSASADKVSAVSWTEVWACSRCATTFALPGSNVHSTS